MAGRHELDSTEPCSRRRSSKTVVRHGRKGAETSGSLRMCRLFTEFPRTEGTSDWRSRSSFAGRQAKRSSGKAGNGSVPWRGRWSLSGRLPRYRDFATGGVRTPWVGVKARVRAIACVLVGGVDAGPCPIQSPTGSLRALHGIRATQRPPCSHGGRAAKTGDRRRRDWGSRGYPVVLGIRLDCRSHRAASGRKRPRESVEKPGLAQCARARWCKKTSTPVLSSWPGGGTERPTRAGLRAGA